MAKAACTVEFRHSKHGPSAILFDQYGHSINARNYPKGYKFTAKEKAAAKRSLMKGCGELSKRPNLKGAPRRPRRNDALDTVHTMTMKDGTVVTTTWHNTRGAASSRIAKPRYATFRKVFHEPRGSLGPYRAVTWS